MSYGEWRVGAGVRWVWGVLTALVLIVLIAIAIVALIAAIGGNIFALVVFALAVPLAYWAGRACSRIPSVALTIDAEEIVVVGALKTVRVLTRHADAFVAEVRPSIGGGQPTIALRHDGYRSVGLWLFNRYGGASRYERLIEELGPTVDELNAALAKAKGGGAPEVAEAQQVAAS